MLPTVLTHELMEGVEAFLKSTFPTTTPAFQKAFDHILTGIGRDRLFQGPYLRVGLPYRKGSDSRKFFPRIETKFPPHLHQEKAWQRLRTEARLSTLVATGTGSGKTECFLYPILDHILSEPSKGGIKAVILYPMNALATDQARRFAEEIHRNEATKGKVRVGLYVGGHGDDAPTMARESVITSRQALRQDPPDILMTNYKMLDYLLIRPEDKGIWSENDSEALKYLVVDELHTFDGAQGSDLACLIRRLKARLKTPENSLCCVGTSATLGNERGGESMVEFAENIFGETFEDPAACIVTEDRIRPAEHIGLERIEAKWHDLPDPEDADKMAPSKYGSILEFLSAQFALWFPGEGDNLSDTPEDRFALANRLRDHQFLRTLLTILGSQPTTSELEVIQAIRERRPKWDTDHLQLVCHSFVSLCAFARDPLGDNGTTPFLQIRSEVWMRELARLVGTIHPKPQIKFAIDLPAEPLNQHLPVMHCRDCGAMGWGARQKTNTSQLLPELDKFYEAFFAYNPDPRIRYVFPLAKNKSEALLQEHLCGNCLTLFDSKDGTCPQCNTMIVASDDGEGDAAVGTFPVESWQRTKARGSLTIADLSCPYCDSRTGMTIVGSRSASLTSVALSQIFGSPFNDDKKAMAFSDSVQDASHRAGFFGARTYPIAFRTALQKVIDKHETPIALKDLAEEHPQHWLTELGPEDFVGTFIPPSYEWNLDYERLEKEGTLPDRSRLPDEIVERLSWDTYREFGLQSRIGRTLEKSGSAASGSDTDQIEKAVDRFMQLARENAGFSSLTRDRASQFLLALCERLRRNGGIHHPFLESYIAQKGNDYPFNSRKALPNIARPGRGRRPTFFATFSSKESFERLIAGGSTPTWTQLWVEKALGLKESEALIGVAVQSLVENELWKEYSLEGNDNGKAWGLNPEKILVSKFSEDLNCDLCLHSLTVPKSHVDLWIGSPCLRHKCEGTHVLSKSQGLTFFGDLYKRGDVIRVRSKEHTGLLEREDREALEKSFMREDSRSTDPKLLSCTPTLEMGVDIGSLSTVLMCSVPPEQANYAQRIGRGGRHDGNSLALTVATGDAHDLTFYESPEKMIAGDVRMPAIFLNAPAVLERQLTAFCIDRWVEETPSALIPIRMEAIYAQMSGDGDGSGSFPNSLFEFIEVNLGNLLEGFLSMFASDVLSKETRAHLENFLKGENDESGSLSYKLQTLLAEAHKNREDLFQQRKKVNRALARNQKKSPRDEKLDNEAELLKAQRQSMSRLIKQLNEKQTLNFLTDEGVLPNYAFPEQGVVLRSVILKKPPKDSGESKLIKADYEHMRPAEAAITELAPGNSFYVQGRKLTVDRVSVNEDDFEAWHFCRSCSYMEPYSPESEDRHHCPHCGCGSWRDNSLKQSMLKMRQVFVTAWDDKSRSGDQKDTRELTTFNKQTSITYRKSSIEKAYSIKTEEVGFAFEFLREVDLREVNFGQERFDSEPIEIGGKKLRGVGFKVCSECGKIWNSVRRKGHQLHDISCRHFGTEEEEHFNRSFLLYRNLNSEAIRLMIPSLSADDDEEAQSFIAALHLGLRKKFGGDLTHLKLGIQYQPVPGLNLRTQHVFLYDSVPGGTGYLKDLTRDADSLIDVLEIAHKELSDCECGSDIERDGCYQCIKAYRFRYVDNKVSRRIALRQLAKILDSRDKVEEREGDESIINPLLESELEKRFIARLRGEKGFKVRPEIVKGKPGYFLKIGETSWHLNLQQDLGSRDGIDIACRPDVIIEPVRPNVSKPIAVFLDGYAYHADEEIGNNRIADDFAKRNAILRTGKWEVFSLTWDDLNGENFEEGAFLEPGLKMLGKLLAEPLADAPLWKTSVWNSWSLLKNFLEIQSETKGRAVGWHKVACFTGMTGATKGQIQGEDLRDLFEKLINGESIKSDHDDEGDTLTLYQEDGRFKLLASTPLDAIKDKSFARSSAMLWFNDKHDDGAENFRELWRQFLRAANILQFIPRFAVTTKRMLSSGELGNSVEWVSQLQYEDTREADTELAKSELNEEQIAELEMAEPGVAGIIASLVNSGKIPFPKFCHELLLDSGICEGSFVEAAWVEEKVAVCLPEDEISGFVKDGWTLIKAETLTEKTLIETLDSNT